MIKHKVGTYPEQRLEITGIDHDLTNEEIVAEICTHIANYPSEYKEWITEMGYYPDAEDPEGHPDSLSKPENWLIFDEGNSLRLSNFVLYAYVGGDTEHHLVIEFEID